ncbi:MAG TPA: hypothetical protein DCP28_07220, partial [Cytophagales bacterium]|nr:hypothetical protein [Cytophagales bacterium]
MWNSPNPAKPSSFTHPMQLLQSLLLLLALSAPAFAQNTGLNVLHYRAVLMPDIQAQYLKGQVTVEYELPLQESEMVLDAGGLEIDYIDGEQVEDFAKKGSKLRIQLSPSREPAGEMTIHYQGSPNRGLLFDPEGNQAYTVYFTSAWMPCHDVPHDKAKIDLNIVVPEGLDCVASGDLFWKEEGVYHWSQKVESPTYTYGFAIGDFQSDKKLYQNTQVANYAVNYELDELRYIFRETPAMLAWFEEKTGVPYDQSSYSQVLMGNHYQEMSGFAVLRDSYGALVLKDSTETNLISHELA